jgi:general secretion pathway protein L
MLNLNSTIDFDIKKFYRWWKRELSFFVPEKIKLLIEDRHGTLIVRPDGSQFDVSFALDGQIEHLAKLDRNEAGVDQYKALLAKDERLSKADLIFRLSKRYGIQKEIALPVAAKENLYQVVSYELSRYSPFNSEQAYFAVKPLDVINEPGQMRVLLILTAKKVLDIFFADLKALGMSPSFVDYEGIPNDLDSSDGQYNLLPDSLRDKPARTPQLIYSTLIGAVLLLLGAAMVTPVWLEYQAVQDLENKLIPIEKEAKKIQAIQLQIDSKIDETRKIIDQKNAAPAMLVMLNTLSNLIKDDTWVTYVQYSDGHLQIQGESPAASTLISLLEASEIFSNARFISPVTQDNISKLERFQITVDTTSPKATDDKTNSGKPVKKGARHGNQ